MKPTNTAFTVLRHASPGSRTLRLAVAGVLIANASACSQASGDQKLTIGALLPLTGSLSHYGPPQTTALQLAMEDVNKAGGVLGKQLALQIVDDATDKERGKVGAAQLVDAGVPVVIGSIASGVTMAAAEVLSKAGIVQISPDSTSPSISSMPDDGYVFRTCPSDAFQGKLLAQRAFDAEKRRAAVINVPGPYGEGLAAAFKAEFTRLTGQIVYALTYTEGLDSYADVVTAAVASDPDVILLAGYANESVKILQNYVATHRDRGTRWLFADCLSNAAFVDAAGGAGTFTFPHEGANFAAPSGDNWTAFTAAYRAKAGSDATIGFAIGNAYDAVVIAALAMERAQSTSPAKVRDALLQLKGGPKYTAATLKDALAAAKAGQNVEYTGVSGPIVFDGNGDITSALYNIWAVNGSGVIANVTENVAPR